MDASVFLVVVVSSHLHGHMPAAIRIPCTLLRRTMVLKSATTVQKPSYPRTFYANAVMSCEASEASEFKSKINQPLDTAETNTYPIYKC